MSDADHHSATMLAKTSSGEQLTTCALGTNLNDLATELLIMILDLLDDTELFHFALLSKRFHYIALPIYISRQRGYYSNTHVYISCFPSRLLHALRVALFVDDISSIEMMFTAKSSVVHAMKELERLIRRSRHVQTITVDFSYLQGKWEQAGSWKAVLELMEVMVENACKDLTIQSLHSNVSKTALMMGKGKRRKARKAVLSQSPHDLSPLTTLKQLKIAHSHLICPTLQTWVINSINLSPITNLILNNVSFSSNPSSMSKMLRLLKLPSLTTFSISSPDLICHQLTAFLSRHPRLQQLSLFTHAAITSKSPFPVNTLPLLTSLEAPPHYICYFLASNGSLPSLTRVIFNPNFPLRISDESAVTDGLECIEDSYIHLASRQNITTLRFVLPHGPWAKEWLLRGSRPEKGKRRDLERFLVNVTRVGVDVVGCTGFSPVIEPHLLRWLALFPALRCVNFDPFALVCMADENLAFAKSIMDVCCSVEVVELCWKTYNVS